jgi:redox-sensitive bicupin YhaK (pirin superfamily)
MSIVLGAVRLGFPWQTSDPFLFCVHHDDAYPAGNDRLGPAASLAGRDIGQDFEGKDGWRMYHGDVVPGFPQHPHRGFETVTIARRGYIDHSDSLGATARFGQGDVQWLTAGKGIVHSEMFPLLAKNEPNPLELFQIWLNLPRADKMVEPHFSMLWAKDIPRHVDRANGAEIVIVAGKLEGASLPPSPPPKSWASRPESEIAIWTIRLPPGARVTLPSVSRGVDRMLYVFRGDVVQIADEKVPKGIGVALASEADVPLVNDRKVEVELLLLQGRPIGEPVVQYGPFVMNSRAEIQQAFADYQRTQFGGWPWPVDGPVHARDQTRFAIHADGHTELRTDPASSPGEVRKE